MIHVDAALVEILSSRPYEYVIAGTSQDYNTYLWSCGMYDRDDAMRLERPEQLRDLHNAVIVLAGDRFAISPTYQEETLIAMSRDNIIVERGLGGNTRRYRYAKE